MNIKFGLVSLLKLSVQKYINEELIVRAMHVVRLYQSEYFKYKGLCYTLAIYYFIFIFFFLIYTYEEKKLKH